MQNVIAFASENQIIALAGIDSIITFASADVIVIVTGIRQIITIRVCQDGIMVVHHVPVRIHIACVDQIITGCAVDISVGFRLGLIERHVRNPDHSAVLGGIAIVIDNLDADNRSRNGDGHRIRRARSFDPAIVGPATFYGVAIDLMMPDQVGKADRNDIAIGVMGNDGYLVIPATGPGIHVIQFETDVFNCGIKADAGYGFVFHPAGIQGPV